MPRFWNQLFWITVSLTAIVAAMVLGGLAFDAVMRVVFGLEGGVSGWIWLTLMALALAPTDWIRWDRRYRIVGRVHIEASPARVWDEIALRPRSDYYLNAVAKITADEIDPRIMLVHHVPALMLGDAASAPLQAQITDADPRRYFRYEPLNPDVLPGYGQDMISAEVTLTPADGGGTDVTLAETLSCLRPATVLSLFWLNPCRDAARALKARCEGYPDMSWMGRTSADMLSGGDEAHVERDLRRVGLMAACVSVGLIGLVLSVVLAGVL